MKNRIKQLELELREKATTKKDKRGASVPLSSDVQDLIERITSAKGNNEPLTSKRSKYSKLKPFAQIAIGSSLGNAFGRINVPKGRPKGSPSDSPSDPSSEDSSPDSEDSEPLKKRRNKRKSSKREKEEKPSIKPTPPDKYDGTADRQVFQKFLTHGTAYVKFGRVPEDQRVFTLSQFLAGKAYMFYLREVSLNPAEWELPLFFEELFNYCFPVDYRSQQRKRLKFCRQGDRPVREFVSELNELFVTIGLSDKREKINKLRYGLRPSLQKKLRGGQLNPETSEWRKIVLAAEHYDLAEAANVGDNSKKKNDKQAGQKGSTDQPNSGSPNKQGNSQRREKSGKDKNKNGQSRQNNNGNGSGNRTNGSNQQKKAKTQLSDKEKEELRAADKRFKRKETGHIARNCPTGNAAKGGQGKPPGLSGFNVEPAEATNDRSWGDLADTTEGMDSMDLEFNSVQLDEEDGYYDDMPLLASASNLEVDDEEYRRR